MLVKIAMMLTGISIALLSLYGIDVAIIESGGEGILPLDAKTRGMSLGLPSVVLPFVAYAITLRRKSMGLGIMIIVSGILIIAGGAFILAAGDTDSGRSPVNEAMPLVAIGAILCALGAIKALRSRA